MKTRFALMFTFVVLALGLASPAFAQEAAAAAVRAASKSSAGRSSPPASPWPSRRRSARWPGQGPQRRRRGHRAQPRGRQRHPRQPDPGPRPDRVARDLRAADFADPVLRQAVRAASRAPDLAGWRAGTGLPRPGSRPLRPAMPARRPARRWRVRRSLALTPFDGLLLLMVLIWGANYSVVKAALTEILPQAFNALQLLLASAVFAAAHALPGPAADRAARLGAPGACSAPSATSSTRPASWAAWPAPPRRTVRSSSAARPSPWRSPAPSPATSACRAPSGPACSCRSSASTSSSARGADFRRRVACGRPPDALRRGLLGGLHRRRPGRC